MRLSTGLVYSFALWGCTTALPHSTGDGSKALSLQMAQSIMSREQGILNSQADVSALLQAGFTQKTFHALGSYYQQDPCKPALDAYITRSVDSVVPVVSNATKDTSYPLDRLSNGNGLLLAWQETKLEKYHVGVSELRRSVDLQPKNAQGGLWYYVYPYWSYLDGMYSYAPFMTAYMQAVSSDPYCLDDIELQLDLLWQHCFVKETGLLVHGYDARREAVWANNVTGASPHVWGRSLGWYCMALIDMLDLLPASAEATRANVAARFQQLMGAVARAVDSKTGAWWQVLDQPGREGNYIESSGSSMFIYSLLKGVRLGVLTRDHDAPALTQVAHRAYEYVANTFVVHNANGTLGWNGTVSVCSLNSTATYEYYVGRPILYNSVLGSAAFVLASLEYERSRGK